MRRLGVWRAILISSALFAVAHGSLYRFLPTFTLGIMLAFVVLRSGSILCSMIAHALNNGVAVTMIHYQSEESARRYAEMSALPWDVTIVGTAICAIGLWLVHSAPAARAPSAPAEPG